MRKAEGSGTEHDGQGELTARGAVYRARRIIQALIKPNPACSVLLGPKYFRCYSYNQQTRTVVCGEKAVQSFATSHCPKRDLWAEWFASGGKLQLL